MNYLELILQFWKLRRSKRITSKQADLYFYLLQECNERNWENPFECSNKLICASIDISEPALIDARNRLQQVGLIEFNAGKRNEKSPVYRLFNLKSNLNNLSRNRDETLVESLDETEMKAQPIRNKLNQTKQNQTSSSPGKPEEKKKKTVEYWQVLVKTWFEFYSEKFGQEPSFPPSMAAHLKSIVVRIRKISDKKGFEWTEQHAIRSFHHFLAKAWEDEWLRANFLLTNLSTKFDSIVNSKAHGIAKAKPATGSSVSTGSILAKINAMPD